MLVQAITTGDLDLLAFGLLFATTPGASRAVGVPNEVSDKVTKGSTNLKAHYDALVKKLKGWDRSTIWSRFDGAVPHAMPVDPALGLVKEILLYENPVVFVQPANPETNATGMAYLQAADVIKLGETWKFSTLPQAVDPAGQPPSLEGGLRTALVENGGRPPIIENDEPGVAEALADLAKYDQEHSPGPNATKKDVAEYHFGRIEKLKAIVAATKKPETRLIHNKVIVNSFGRGLSDGILSQRA